MAEEEEQQQEGIEYEASSSSGFNKIITILIYLALGIVGIILMSVIAYYVARKAAAQQYQEVASIAVVKPPPPTENFNFSDDFRVNTSDPGETHFVKLKLSLGFERGNPALSAELAQRIPQLRNIINLTLMGKSKNELSNIEDHLELQEEIKASINHVLANGKITEIYFNELIVN